MATGFLAHGLWLQMEAERLGSVDLPGCDTAEEATARRIEEFRDALDGAGPKSSMIPERRALYDEMEKRLAQWESGERLAEPAECGEREWNRSVAAGMRNQGSARVGYGVLVGGPLWALIVLLLIGRWIWAGRDAA